MKCVYADAFLDINDMFAVMDPPSRVDFFTNPVTITKNKIWLSTLYGQSVPFRFPLAIGTLQDALRQQC